MTLKQLLEARPQWADLPIVVTNANGAYAYVGASAMVYDSVDQAEIKDGQATPVLVFSAAGTNDGEEEE